MASAITSDHHRFHVCVYVTASRKYFFRVVSRFINCKPDTLKQPHSVALKAGNQADLNKTLWIWFALSLTFRSPGFYLNYVFQNC